MLLASFNHHLHSINICLYDLWKPTNRDRRDVCILFVFSRRRGAPRGSHIMLRYGRNMLRYSICYPLGSC